MGPALSPRSLSAKESFARALLLLNMSAMHRPPSLPMLLLSRLSCTNALLFLNDSERERTPLSPHTRPPKIELLEGVVALQTLSEPLGTDVTQRIAA
jgi:hypothetical protein